MHAPYFSEVDIPKPGELGAGSWRLRKLTAITALFGKNGSGKSKLLRTWRNMNAGVSHYVVPERAGEIDYQANHLMDQMQASGRQNQTQRNFQGEYRRQVIARIQAYFAARGDYRGGALPTDPGELEALIAPLLPDFALTLSGTNAPPYKLKRLSDDRPVENIDQLSSGETQIITLALDILTITGIWEIQGVEQRLMLIDEPDAHIHPDLQVRFADFLIQVASRFKLQVVVATHSTALLAAIGHFAGGDASVLYLDRSDEELAALPFTDVLRELSACLGGHALMGPLFGDPILLVEGDDDYRIWSQVPRYHQVNFSTIAAGGDEIKRYQQSLEKVFAALRDDKASDAGYALIDGDKGKPQPSDTLPQNHIRYIQLACHESENLYLSDEVLGLLNLDWPTAQTMIGAAAPKWGQLEAKLNEIVGCDRRTIDIKPSIQALSEILDPKKVLWTIRVAQALGKQRPTGQIADFLGEEVLTAIWGKPPPEKAPEFQAT